MAAFIVAIIAVGFIVLYGAWPLISYYFKIWKSWSEDRIVRRWMQRNNMFPISRNIDESLSRADLEKALAKKFGLNDPVSSGETLKRGEVWRGMFKIGDTLVGNPTKSLTVLGFGIFFDILTKWKMAIPLKLWQ